ncbi:hypothetical protein D9757_004623 [Collybiopsis confluens]|uniref:Uncharacterized protein n=1 Tax=Collybiopsis confluens TaxID=2823264 RepID=A0A8H5MC30_9AGAR|nr:hypothetical protein D9757_004623 [Collybiopsis confluens]
MADSLTLSDSLAQSRTRWLTSVLPKFQPTQRKNPKHDPAPYTLHHRGCCQLHIGPHIFPNTTLYEARYRPTPSVLGALEPTMATPSFIAQINAAAASNPTLANLLQLVTNGQADQTQRQILSYTLKSLAESPTSASQYAQLNAQTQSTPSPYAPTKTFDLLVEFQESPSERFLLPRGTTACERVEGENDFKIVVTSCAPLQSKDLSLSTENDPSLFRMTLHDASEPVWDSLTRWAGGEEKIKENVKILNKMARKKVRARLPTPRTPVRSPFEKLSYSMKSIKPAMTLPNKLKRTRKAAPKAAATPDTPHFSAATPTASLKSAKWKQSVTETDDNLSAAMDLAAAITGAANSVHYSPPSTAPSRSPPASSAPPRPGTPNALPLPFTFHPPPKKHRKKSMAPAAKLRPPTAEIMCRSCQAKDVPLMLGGRFCRACIDAGRGNADIPQIPSHASHAPVARQPSYHAPANFTSSREQSN